MDIGKLMKRIKSVVLFYNSNRRKALSYAAAIERRLKAGGARVSRVCVNDAVCEFKPADAAVAVGGDGTVLYAARHVIARGMPVLGINAGGLGFLSGAEQKDFLKNADEFLRGGFIKIKRSLLSVSVLRGGRTVSGPLAALNDCVIRSSEARAFTLRASFGGKFLSEYFGDGLIVSTPSGSTAYSLAASGPIVMPDLEVFLLSPICPHTLTHRPIVLSAAEDLRVLVQGGRSGPQRLALSLDGQENFTLEDGDTVLVRRHTKSFEMLAPQGFSYFDILRRKLSWGER
jgi:NAD+ kinase